MSTTPEDQKPEPEETMREQVPQAAASIEDDFGDEPLGARQPQACSMEEGCTVCQ